MNNSADNIKKDLSEQPNFKDEIGSKDQDHHTFDLGNQSTLKKIQHFLHGNPTIVPVIILILSVIATLIFFTALMQNKKNYIFASILIFFIAFFNKQVPTSYFIIFCILIYMFRIFSSYDKLTLFHTFIYTLIISIIFMIYFNLNDVSFENIYDQYITIATNLG